MDTERADERFLTFRKQSASSGRHQRVSPRQLATAYVVAEGVIGEHLTFRVRGQAQRDTALDRVK